uniref:Receptor expression-enhancing protein n=1 Tax=Globodera pallida TaxID=36090 RepID=A0A183CJA8_GLOPA
MLRWSSVHRRSSYWEPDQLQQRYAGTATALTTGGSVEEDRNQNGLWVTETTAEMFLAFNRCVELSNSGLANLLFGGKRIYLWMAVPTLYGLYFLMFTKPIIFNGIYITWFQNPHVGYIDSFEDTSR